MNRISEKVITGTCYGITQQVIEGLASNKNVKVTMSLNLGGTNNHREYIISGNPDDLDLIHTEYAHYLKSK